MSKILPYSTQNSFLNCEPLNLYFIDFLMNMSKLEFVNICLKYAQPLLSQRVPKLYSDS